MSNRRGLGPHASRRGLLQAGLAIGTLALGQRAALGQPGGAHAHMPELGVAKLPVVPAMDQPLVEPEVRRSANGVVSTSLRCAHAYRDFGGKRLYLRSYEGGLGPTLRIKPGETLKIRLTNDFPPNRDLVPRIFRVRINSTTRTSTSTARTAVRAASPTTSCARWCPTSHTTSRSRCPRTTRAAPTGTIRITTAPPMCRLPAAWREPSSSRAISPICRRSPGRASGSCWSLPGRSTRALCRHRLD